MLAGLECGHLFCTQCWTEYLTTKIVDEGASQMIECPGACNIVVDDQTVMNLITDPRYLMDNGKYLMESKNIYPRQGQAQVPAPYHQQLRPVQQTAALVPQP